MTEQPLARFDRAGTLAEGVIAAVKAERLEDPTPCTDWSVRHLINHVVTGNLMFASIVNAQPAPDRSQDHVGDDPVNAFRDTLRGLRAAFSAEGALDRTYPTPLGQGPGSLMVQMRTIEMTIHSWDIAKATGQPTDLDPDLAEWALESIRSALPADRSNSPFGTEQPAPPGATAADRLAAFTGRTVG